MEQNKVMKFNEWYHSQSDEYKTRVTDIDVSDDYAAYYHAEMSKLSVDVEGVLNKEMSDYIKSLQDNNWSDIIPSESEQQHIKAWMKRGYQLGQGECTELLEWLLKSEFKKDEDICFRAYNGTGSHQYATPELLTIFKNR